MCLGFQKRRFVEKMQQCMYILKFYLQVQNM